MAIDYDALDAVSVSFPTKKISVPTLKKFFPEDEDPVIEIRGLTGAERARGEESAQKVGRLKAAMEAFAKDTVKGFKEGYNELLNGDAETPETYMRWITIVRLGTVPSMPEHIVVKLAHSQGGLVRRLAHEISVMSAMGADLGE